MYDIESIKKDVEKYVSEFRYQHSLMVADEAEKLAEYYQLDSLKAYIVGLAHDIAKDFSDSENDLWIKKYHLSDELYLEKYRDIIHADIGAVVVKEWYQFDLEMCEAILYHSIGNIKMNKFAKVIFLADKIARRNVTDFVKKLRKLVYEDLDEALVYYLNFQRKRLAEKGYELHRNSLELLESLTK